MTTSAHPPAQPNHALLHPLVVMIIVILVAAAATYALDAGKFAHHGKLITPGTYHVIPKSNGLDALLAPTAPAPTDKPARAASLVSLFTCLPSGMLKGINLIIMIFCAGGMFETLRRTGAIDAGIDRLLSLTRGNVYSLSFSLMLALATASTFLGTLTEYLLVIPIVALIGDRLKLPRMFAMAVVGIAAKIGFAAAVTNPYALTVSQPMADVPIFSGMGLRLAVFAVMLALGMGYVFLFLRRARLEPVSVEHDTYRLRPRQVLVLLTLLVGGTGLVTGTKLWGWGGIEDAAFYIALALAIAVVAGLRPADAAETFMRGMQSMMLGALMVAMAGSAELVLTNSQVMDTIVAAVTQLAKSPSPPVVANALLAVEMLLDIVIPSVSGKAALSIPILLPIAQLSGISGQTTVLAFVLGSGLMNMVTPTCGPLLAFLAAARVGYISWMKFILPLWLALCLVAVITLSLAAIFHI